MVAFVIQPFNKEIFLRLVEMFGPPQHVTCSVFSDLITNKLNELDPDFDLNNISYSIINPTREKIEQLIEETDRHDKVEAQALMEKQKHSLTRTLDEMLWLHTGRQAGIESTDFRLRATPTSIEFFITPITDQEIVAKAEDFWKSFGKYAVKISSD